MKKVVFAIAIAPLTIYGCKKSEPVGSPYTAQMAGTREYRYVLNEHINSYDTTAIDTVSIQIKYISPSSITFNSTTLTYSLGQSNDSVLVFVDPSLSQYSSGRLSYERLSNKVRYETSNHLSAGGQFDVVYISL